MEMSEKNKRGEVKRKKERKERIGERTWRGEMENR